MQKNKNITRLENTNIFFKEIEKFDTNNDTIKILVNFEDKEAGIIIGTGHYTLPVFFNLTSELNLYLVMKELLKTVQNNVIDKTILIEVFTESKGSVFYIEKEKVGVLTDKEFIFFDDELLGFFLMEITSLLSWED